MSWRGGEPVRDLPLLILRRKYGLISPEIMVKRLDQNRMR